MNFKTLYNELKSLGYPVAYSHFSEGDIPTPPFITYLLDSTDNFSADGKVYSNINGMYIELYNKVKDLEVEKKIETLLTDNNIFYEKNEYYIESSKLIEVVYSFDILE